MSSPAGKKVIIVGAGAQGIVITGVLAAAEDVAEIVLGDIDVSRAREIAQTNGSPKIRVIELDATDLGGMTRVMKAGSFDLVINATLPRFVHKVMKAAYAARIGYIDMASNEIYPAPGVPTEHFLYADEWKEAGLQCLTGGGGDPGLTNIMAKLGVDEMDSVDSIKIKDFGVVECDEPVALWSMETFFGGRLSGFDDLGRRQAPGSSRRRLAAKSTSCRAISIARAPSTFTTTKRR